MRSKKTLMYFLVRDILLCWGALRGSIRKSQLGTHALHTEFCLFRFLISQNSNKKCLSIWFFVSYWKRNWGEALRSRHSLWKQLSSYGILYIESISLDKHFCMLVSLVKYIPQGLICQLHLHIQGFKADRHGLWFDSMNLLRFRCQLQSSWANSSQESVTEVLSVIRDHTSGMPQACMPEFSWAFALHQVHTAPAQLTFGPRANCLLILICSYIFKLKLCKEGMVAAKNI